MLLTEEPEAITSCMNALETAPAHAGVGRSLSALFLVKWVRAARMQALAIWAGWRARKFKEFRSGLLHEADSDSLSFHL